MTSGQSLDHGVREDPAADDGDPPVVPAEDVDRDCGVTVFPG